MELKSGASDMVDVMGKKVTIPVKYSNSSAYMVFLLASLSKIRERLPDKRIIPVKIFGDRCVLGITVFDYETCDVGPYKELAISIPVVFNPKINIPILPLIFENLFKDYGFYTLELAMNTEIAREHAKKIFGYPTYDNIIDISTEQGGGFTNIRIKEGSNHIVSFSAKNTGNFKVKNHSYNTYFRYGRGLNNVLLTATTYEVSSFRGGELVLGSHAISSTISDLILSHKPIMSIYYKDVTEILSKPKDLGIE